MFGWLRSRKGRTAAHADGDGEILDHLASHDVQSTRHFPRSPRQAIEPESVPEPPLDMNPKRSPIFVFFNGVISLIIFAIVLSAAVFYVGKQQFEAPGPLKQTRSVIVPRGETLTQIARRLEREGVVADASLFLAGVYVSGTSDQLKAGEYLFRESASMHEVMDLLVAGKTILHRITIPEGLTSEQIVARLMESDVLVGEVTAPPEGSLLPDTYAFTRGTARAAIIERMRKARDRALARVWKRRDKNLPLKTPDELVILASIVEKETGKADERPRVASVFINRLKRSMRLQSDPTIIYGIAGGRGSLGRPILKSEIEAETPYNTYRIEGLPPTPIANPGIAALEATANPSRTDDLYFVADGTGGHVFAASLAEHNSNVARWRKIAAEAARAAEAAEQEEQAGKEKTGEAVPIPPLKLDLKSLR